MAEREDGAAALFQGFNRLFGPVHDLVPPAVLLAVDDIRAFLHRRGAGDRDGHADGDGILFAVDHHGGESVFRFLPRAEGGGEMGGQILALAFIDNTGRRAQFIPNTGGVIAVRHNGDIDIITGLRVGRREEQLCFRQRGRPCKDQQQDSQAQDRFSESVHLHPNIVFVSAARLSPPNPQHIHYSKERC